MMSFQKREDPILLMKRRILIVVLLVIALLLSRAVYGVFMKEEESRILREEVETELAGLEARETEIRMNIAELASERGVERALRSEYELARDGEGVIVIVGEDAEETPPPASPTHTPWWRIFR